jgi:hypothetical protein
MVVIFSTFVFVLSVILIGKSPKAGACLVGSLLVAGAILLLRTARGGLFSTPMGLPFAIIPGTFLFVLIVIVLAKVPKAGGVLVVALAVMGLFGMFFIPRVSHQPQTATVVQGSSTGVPLPPGYPQPGMSRPLSLPSATPAPIWLPGVDKEFDADVYPSKLAAVEAMGRRIDKAVRELTGDVNAPRQITLFQEVSEPALIAGLRNAIQQALPQSPCTVEANLRDVRAGEVGVITILSSKQAQPVPWSASSETRVTDGTVHVHLSTVGGKRITLEKQFVEMPWVENFAAFASTRPQQAFIIARSLGTCTSESEANQQALDDACARLAQAIGVRGGQKLGPSAPPITTADVLQGGFVVDRFAQSLEGSVGKIWRQALLLDVSGAKLSQLAHLKAVEFRQVEMSWARMALSAVGVLVLIGAIYFFLNMATMGYYEWSLRIAGVVLAIVAVISILMVVH